MSVNKRSDEILKKLGTYVFSVLCGFLVSFALLAAFSGLMYVLGLPPGTAGVLSVTALGAGSLLSGFICGSIKKRGGLKAGFICGLSAAAVIFAVSLLAGGVTGTSAVSHTAVPVVCSCIGSVVGVNRRTQP